MKAVLKHFVIRSVRLSFAMRASRLRKSFKKALTTMGIRKEEAVMIGDQLMTDILGGNRKGLHTILVVPVAIQMDFSRNSIE